MRIGDLCSKMIHTRQNLLFPEVFRLLKLALVLPVATSSVERLFSTINFIKNKLTNKISNQWMNDCLVTYIERAFFANISNKAIMHYYQIWDHAVQFSKKKSVYSLSKDYVFCCGNNIAVFCNL